MKGQKDLRTKKKGISLDHKSSKFMQNASKLSYEMLDQI